MIRKLMFVALFASFVPTAEAAVSQRTKYNYFTVSGKSATSIHASVVSRSKRKGRAQTYATTEVQMLQKLTMLKGSRCKVVKADILLRLNINLPRHKNVGSLASQLQSDWTSFAGDLKQHEEHHRELWMACAARYQSAIQGLSASSCNGISAKSKATLQSIEKACRAENDAFDAREQQRLRGIGFIKRVIAGK